MSRFHDCAVSLVENGYTLVHIPAGSKGPQTPGWQQLRPSVDDVRAWGRGNIGIQTAATPAVDIDVLDEAVADSMQRVVEALLGEAPVRVGRAPKRLLVYRTIEPFAKVASAAWYDAEGRKHQVEILGRGQQFAAYGTHPDTKKPYRWLTEDTPQNMRAADLCLIDRAAALKIAAEFDAMAEAAGWERRGGARAGAEGDDDLGFLRPKPDMTNDEVRALLAAVENPGRDYDLWMDVGFALHHHFEGGPEGLELWHEWSSRSPLYDSGACEYKWRSMGKYTGRSKTAAFLIERTGDLFKTLRAKRADDFRDQIAACDDVDVLVTEIAPAIHRTDMPSHRREMLLRLAQQRASKVAGVRIPIAEFKGTKAQQKDEVTPQGMLAELRLELDLARYVLDDQFGGDRVMRFSKLWWEYRNGVWARAEEDVIGRRVMESLVALAEAKDARIEGLFERMAESRGDRLNSLVATVVSMLEKACATEGNDDPLNLCAERVPRVLNTQNAELWFEHDGSFSIKEHDPAHKLSAQIGCIYDPEATCPTWDQAIRKVFKKARQPEEVIRHFEELIGYVLQQTRHVAIWLMLKGPGGNGKSFLLRVITELMGNNAVAARSISDLASGRAGNHFTDGLVGKLMLLDDDFEAGAMLPDAWLKKLSEAKVVTADPKHAKAYNFVARSVPVILANQWPPTVDLSEGLRRRAMIFESNYVLRDEDKDPAHLERILDGELPGVLNRLIAGLQRFLARGQRFDIPAECEAAKEAWLTSSNATALFSHEVLQRVSGASVRASVVYDAYENWIRFAEHNVRALGRNKFYEALERLGYRKANRNGICWFVDLKIRPVEGLEFMFPNEEDDL